MAGASGLQWIPGTEGMTGTRNGRRCQNGRVPGMQRMAGIEVPGRAGGWIRGNPCYCWDPCHCWDPLLLLTESFLPFLEPLPNPGRPFLRPLPFRVVLPAIPCQYWHPPAIPGMSCHSCPPCHFWAILRQSWDPRNRGARNGRWPRWTSQQRKGVPFLSFFSSVPFLLYIFWVKFRKFLKLKQTGELIQQSRTKNCSSFNPFADCRCWVRWIGQAKLR